MELKKAPHKEDIKAAVRKSGTTFAAISRAAGLGDRTAAASLSRPQPSGNKAIAEFLGLPLHYLWPTWFDSAGKRVFSQKKSKHIRKLNTPHHKKNQSNF